MLKRLDEIEKRFAQIEKILSDSATLSDKNLFNKLSKEHRQQIELIHLIKEYRSLCARIEEDSAILIDKSDPELMSLASEELAELENKKKKLEDLIKLRIIPQDPNDRKNIILEIRAGTGGDEAGIFAGDLLSMYSKYAGSKGWKIEEISSSPSAKGGFKEVICLISGKSVYSTLKFESGVHRVQRVPRTESQGRLHTSAASVVVIPEAEEVDIKIEDKDLRIDVFRSTGHGGQSVNTTDSAVRITHIPTKLVVTCQDEKSQLKNKSKALKVLKSRLLDIKRQEQEKHESNARKTIIGSGDRSVKIRTYNFPQNRITDHRINLTLYKLDSVIDGDLDDMVKALAMADNTEKLNGPGFKNS
ncbi:MAG: peptide chain release factor 1 [bacterium]